MTVALVTGGASGLGLATATALQKSGYDVVVIDLPNARGKDELPAGVAFAPADVRDEEQVGAAVAQAVAMGDLRVPAYDPQMLNGEVVRLDGALRMPAR